MWVDCPWQATRDGVTLRVRLTPKGGRDALEGIERRPDGTCVLKARVRAAPHEGAANAALEALLARALALGAGHVRLAGGATARIKTLRIEGDAAALAAKLAALTGSAA